MRLEKKMKNQDLAKLISDLDNPVAQFDEQQVGIVKWIIRIIIAVL